jgi:hypothetical protein
MRSNLSNYRQSKFWHAFVLRILKIAEQADLVCWLNHRASLNRHVAASFTDVFEPRERSLARIVDIAGPAFPSFCDLLRSRHTSATVRPSPNPSRVDMPPQQPLARRWERFQSAIPSPRSMADPQRRLQASGVAHPQQSGQSRPRFFSR